MNSTKEFSVGKNNINGVGSNFKEHLHGIDFPKVSAEGLDTRMLPRDMNDAAIAKEFGPAPVLLGDVLAFLKTASHADWYIFYVNDAEGTRWAVRADWGVGGWYVEALPVSRPRGWRGGLVVVSHSFSGSKNTTLSSSEPLSLDAVELDHEARLKTLEAIVKHHNLTSPDVS